MALRTPHGESIPEAWLDILDESIRHRGPDGQGRFRDRAVRADGCVFDLAFVHRRLSIIDHAGGAQPMLSLNGPAAGGPAFGAWSSNTGAAAGTPLLFHGRPDDPVAYRAVTGRKPGSEGRPTRDLVAVVFNGCIYNHRELRAELEKAGNVFATDHADTEVLLHGWRAWGRTLFDRLDGMFAALIWDRASAQLVAVRDPCGKKPLHTFGTETNGGWVLAMASVPPDSTRLSACWAAVSSKTPNRHESLDDWIRFGYGIGSPRPGAYAVPLASGWLISNEGTAFFQHGALAHPDICSKRERQHPIDEQQVEGLLGRAVEKRLHADVPLGCFLSGGVDSSLVAHFARAHVGRLTTFCVRMPDPRFDESEMAAAVARTIGSEHATLDCDAQPADDLVALVRQMGLPLGDSSLLPTLWVSRAARRCVTVALTGDGGDEMFAGYDRYRIADWLPARVPGVSWMERWLALGAHPKSLRSKLARLVGAAGALGNQDLMSIFPTPIMADLLGRPEVVGPNRTIPRRFRRPLGASGAIFNDVFHYLPNALLRKVDSASMSVALEVRCPFLDREVVWAAMRAPISCLMPRGQRKGLLRAVARKYLPAEIVDRPKMGFAIPIGEWFRTDYGGMKTLLMDRLNSAEPFGPPSLGIDLNMGFVRQMLKEHDAAGQTSLWPWKGRDHSQRLYMLLVLSIWADWMGKVARGAS